MKKFDATASTGTTGRTASDEPEETEETGNPYDDDGPFLGGEVAAPVWTYPACW